MDKNNLLDRITLNPRVMTGKPIIKGTRLTVQRMLSFLAQGNTVEEILEEYKGLSREDILACLQFAEITMEKTEFFPLKTKAS
jgi:uncharacterized protein (DUF433 family)